MKKTITPAEAGRELEYNQWIRCRMPMAHITVTLDITHLVRYCRKNRSVPMNAALCYCVGKAANQVKECHLLIEKDEFVWSDLVNVQTIIKDVKGNLRFCDLPANDSLEEYASQYRRIVTEARDNCEHHFEQDRIFVGTSCLSTTLPIDSTANQWNDSYQNMFLMWGAYRRSFFRRYKLPMTLQFHHVQINGGEACQFLEIIQKEIQSL